MPFVLHNFTINLSIPTPPSTRSTFCWKGLVYVLPENCPPEFWQLAIEGNMEFGTDYKLTKLRDGEAGVISLGLAG